MVRILFAYEFGAGLGHPAILREVAKTFIGRHRLTFAVPDPPLINGLGLERGGSSINLPIPSAPSAKDIASNIHRLLDGAPCERGAVECADRLRGFLEDDPLGRVTHAVRAYIE